MPGLFLSLIPLAALCALLALVVSLFGDDALSGAAQISLLICSALAIALALPRRYVRFSDFEEAISSKIASVSLALVILLLIGALAGAWMISGIVPTLIYYGMQLLDPSWFLVSACIICAIVSIMTGSSWTTIATIGVALMGIGEALGISAGWVGGAIISGAYFGDKISPLSDTTVMASSTVGVPLFRHIRFMTGTTTPTLTITLIIFLVAGFMLGSGGDSDVQHISDGLCHTFCISPWLLVVPLITGILIARKVPTLAILFCGVIMACVAACIAQPDLLYQIAGDAEGRSSLSLIRGLLTMLYGNTSIDTGVPMLDDLVSTSGMAGMTATIWLIICAMIFGAAMTSTHMLDSIVHSLLQWPKGPVSMVATTAVTGVFMNVILCDQYLSIIITSSMFRDAYTRCGLDIRLLSRAVEDSATVTSPLFPWSSCGMTQAQVLGISTLTYAPYAFFNYLSPLMTIIMAGVQGKRMQK